MTLYTLSEVESLLAKEQGRGADAIVELTKKYDALVVAERERCCKAMCLHCAQGSTATERSNDRYIWWEHLLEGKITEVCDATRIRRI